MTQVLCVFFLIFDGELSTLLGKAINTLGGNVGASPQITVMVIMLFILVLLIVTSIFQLIKAAKEIKKFRWLIFIEYIFFVFGIVLFKFI